MRISLLLLLFPFTLAAQQLPDSAITAKLGVKKLVILRCEEGFPADTESVYVFDNGWKNSHGITAGFAPVHIDSLRNVVRDEKGRIVFSGPKKLARKCYNDTVGEAYRYDEHDRVIYRKIFSCEKGDAHWYYRYDASGHVIVSYCNPPLPFVPVTREESVYNADGQLLQVWSWWTSHPLDGPDSTDQLVYRVEYSYDKNGLISELKAFDPLHMEYIPVVWTGPTEEPRTPASTVVFRYLYTYAD